MKNSICIAGNRTISDWNTLRPKLVQKSFDQQSWDDAKAFLDLRLEHRYFNAIEAIRSQYSNKLKGEGFAICTLICSLIEAVETFYQGTNFSTRPSNRYEYGFGQSKKIYQDFLTKRAPFSSYFDKRLATDFYLNVRCALLHEACTRNNWVINIRNHQSVTINREQKAINRSLFVSDLKVCVNLYKDELNSSPELQKAFIRKFDGICSNST